MLELAREYPALARRCVWLEERAAPYIDPGRGLGGITRPGNLGRWTDRWQRAGLLNDVMTAPLTLPPYDPELAKNSKRQPRQHASLPPVPAQLSLTLEAA